MAKPGPPPVMMKIRLKIAVNAETSVMMKANWTNLRSSGSVIETSTRSWPAPSTLAAS